MNKKWPPFPFVIGGGVYRPLLIEDPCDCFECLGHDNYRIQEWYGHWQTPYQDGTLPKKEINQYIKAGLWLTKEEAEANTALLDKCAQDGSFPNKIVTEARIKASQCLKLAALTSQKKKKPLTQEQLEEAAFKLMSLPPSRIEARIAKLECK